MNWSLHGSSVHGILQGVLGCVDTSFSRGSSLPRDRTWVPCFAGRFFTIWDTREDQRLQVFSQMVTLYLEAIILKLHLFNFIHTLNWNISYQYFKGLSKGLVNLSLFHILRTNDALSLLLQFSSVKLLSRVRLFETPWIAACQASLSITRSRSFWIDGCNTKNNDSRYTFMYFGQFLVHIYINNIYIVFY